MKALLSAVVLLHFASAVVVAGVAFERPWAKALRPAFAPYEKLIVHAQHWSMFAPDPPKANFFIEVEVLELNGKWRTVQRPTDPPSGSVRWRAWRAGKEERLQFEDENDLVRMARARNECMKAKARGAPVAMVRFSRIWVENLRPSLRLEGEPLPTEVKRKPLGEHRCVL